MEWSEEKVLEFIQNYEAEPIIWDPRNANHKKKHMVADAWRRLKSNLSFEDSTSINELKKKRDSLMAYYRIHINKIKKSIKSGTGTEESYRTNWFAFSAMNSFLGPIYDCSATVKFDESTEYLDISDESSSSFRSFQNDDSPPFKKKRLQDKPDPLHAKKQMDEPFATKERSTERVHECDLYAQLLAQKLKRIDEDRRIILMHNIDNLVFKEIMSSKSQEKTTEASPYSSPSQSNYYMELNSPKAKSKKKVRSRKDILGAADYYIINPIKSEEE